MAQRTNDQRILEQAVKERFAESSEGLSFPEFFAVYAASKILSRYGLTHVEIADGMVGDGENPGIDSIFEQLSFGLSASKTSKMKNPSACQSVQQNGLTTDNNLSD